MVPWGAVPGRYFPGAGGVRRDGTRPALRAEYGAGRRENLLVPLRPGTRQNLEQPGPPHVGIRLVRVEHPYAVAAAPAGAVAPGQPSADRLPQCFMEIVDGPARGVRQPGRRPGRGTMIGLGTAGPSADRGARGAARLTEGLELARQFDDHWLGAMASFGLGFVRHGQGRNEEALACFRAAHVRGRAIGRPRAISRALTSSLDLHLYLDPPKARVMFGRVADLIQQTGDVLLHTLTLARLGTAEHSAGNLDAAAAVLRRALTQHRTLAPLGDPDHDRREMDIRCRPGRTYRAAGRVAEARDQFRAALAVPGAGRCPKGHAQAVEGLAASGTSTC